MDNFQFWRPSRILARVDLGWTVISVIVAAVYFVTVGVLAIIQVANKGDKTVTLVLIIWGTAILVGTLIGVINIWAVVKFLKATTEGGDPTEALRRARIWRNFVIVFLILALLSTLQGGQAIIFAVCQIVVRGFSLYYVVNFIKELQSSLSLVHP